MTIAVDNIMEAELYGIQMATNALMGLSNACKELQIHIPETSTFFTDSQSSIAYLKGNTCSSNSRHMSLKIAAVQGKVEQKLVKGVFIEGKENPADSLTKNLPPALFAPQARMHHYGT